MLNLIQNEILFFVALAFLTFLPGYFLLLAVLGKNNIISSLERFLISFGLSIISVDFILFTYSGLHILITKTSIILGVFIFCAVCFAVYYLRYQYCHSGLDPESKKILKQVQNDKDNLFNFSKNQFVLILLLIFLTVFIKTAYLSTAIAPTATDLGHHLYWAKTIVQNHKLTNYEGMPDFIIGEHTIFASMNILTGLSFFTGWPVIILYLINLLGILTVFILTLRIFKNKLIAILTLLFLGVLFAVASPQAKYVSGGVMGNIFGNFLMPLAFYFYYRAFEFFQDASKGSTLAAAAKVEPLRKFLSLAVLTTFGLFYTHHLTSFIFLFVFMLLIPLFLIVNYKDIEEIIKKSAKLIFTPQVVITLIIGIIFFFFVFTPTYVNPKAVDTAVGAATKSTRVGLSITNLKNTVGEPRLALGLLGLILLILTFRRKNFGYSLLSAWTIMLLVMSTLPNLLFIDLPSSRIGNYTSYPLAIMSAFAFYTVFRPDSCTLLWGKKICKNNLFAKGLFKAVFALLLVFVLASGLRDSVLAFKKQGELAQLNETFSVSKYLTDNTSKKDIILKDHNYITADSWMKLFFMRGYKYPESRGFFSRYEAQGSRSNDLCTLVMISNPNGDDAKKCFSETGTNFLVVNPNYDAPQFQRLPEFDQVYMSNDIAAYYRR